MVRAAEDHAEARGMLDQVPQEPEDGRVECAAPYSGLQLLELVEEQQQVPLADGRTHTRQEVALEDAGGSGTEPLTAGRRNVKAALREGIGDLCRHGQEEARQPGIEAQGLAVEVDGEDVIAQA